MLDIDAQRPPRTGNWRSPVWNTTLIFSAPYTFLKPHSSLDLKSIIAG